MQQETFSLLLLVKVHEYFLRIGDERDLLNGRERHHPSELTPSLQANKSLVLFQCSANEEPMHILIQEWMKGKNREYISASPTL